MLALSGVVTTVHDTFVEFVSLYSVSVSMPAFHFCGRTSNEQLTPPISDDSKVRLPFSFVYLYPADGYSIQVSSSSVYQNLPFCALPIVSSGSLSMSHTLTLKVKESTFLWTTDSFPSNISIEMLSLSRVKFSIGVVSL